MVMRCRGDPQKRTCTHACIVTLSLVDGHSTNTHHSSYVSVVTHLLACLDAHRTQIR
jgi:hypothetical protein